MDDYHHPSLMNPYSRSRYEGIDSKIVVMGNSGVGKTSLLQRYTQNKFDPKNTTSTSGAFFVTKKVSVDGVKVRLQLWDTAGQERFRSMAPMYYRGANAALLLYDITDQTTFNDVRGWLEELKKNCSPDLIIYIVGSKSDLDRHRQVSQDLARLSLHNWFPPPRPPSPPPPPPPPPSTLSYIRPRFTSFPGLKSAPTLNNKETNSNNSNGSGSGNASPPTPQESTLETPSTAAYLDLHPSVASAGSSTNSTRPVTLGRSKSTALPAGSARPRRTSAGAAMLTRSNTTGAGSAGASAQAKTKTKGASSSSRSPTGMRFPGSSNKGGGAGWNELMDNSSNSLNEEEEDGAAGNMESVEEEREWGLSKGMELFEVSAKDDTGISTLFDTLIRAIIKKKDTIEQENERRKRDSVFLTPVATPGWAAQADEEEAREKAAMAKGGWSCC